MVWLQWIIGISYFTFLYYSSKFKSISQIIISILIYNLFFASVLRIIFYHYYGLPFGEAVDSYSYDFLGEKFHNQSLSYYWHHNNEAFNIDDFGYSSFIILVYKLFTPDFGREILILINSILTATSAYVLYRTLSLLNFSHKEACIGCGLWGYFPFLFVTSAVGLKENIFCSIIICAIYYIHSYKRKKTLKKFLLTLLLIAATFFFRFAIALMLVIYFTITYLSNKSNASRMLWLILSGAILMTVIGSVILVAITGISIEQVLATAAWRNDQMGNEVSGQSIQILSALIGPFPNFTRSVQYGIYHSCGLLFKDLMSFFCLHGIISTITQKNYTFYGPSCYYLMGLLMLVVGGVALDMRYAITFYPAFIILLLYGLQKRQNKYLTILFNFIIIGVIIIYNQR